MLRFFTGMATYKRKSCRGSWSPTRMEQAIASVNSKEMGLNKAAKMFDVPKATLHRRLEISKATMKVSGGEKHMGRHSDLPSELESQLVTHVINLEERMFGVTLSDLRRLAYQLAEANKLSHRFNKTKEMAGKKWLYSFLKRHKEIVLRTPEPTSIARAMGFNKPQVAAFFQLLADVIDKHKFTPRQIFNADETGISTVQKLSKVLAPRGKKQVGGLTSAERGVNVTAMCCISASGMYLPPLLIFPRVRMKEELKDGAPPETAFACQKSGWIDSEIFLDWLKHFVKHVRPSETDRALLILDGHVTHVKNLAALEYAAEHFIVMLSLPAHTTHKLQPLDRCFFKSLNSYYDETVTVWMRAHPGRAVTVFQVSRLFGEAYGKAATIATATNAFKKCGIWPCNPNVFEDHEFAGSKTTDRPNTNVKKTSTSIQHRQLPPLPEELPLPQDLPLPEELPLPQDRPMPEELPLPLDLPLPEELPLPQDLPMPEQLPLPLDLPLPEELPLPQDLPLPEELPLPLDLPLPEELPLPQDLPLPEEPSTSSTYPCWTSVLDISPLPTVEARMERRKRKGIPPTEVTSTPYRKLLREQNDKARPKRRLTLQTEDRIGKVGIGIGLRLRWTICAAFIFLNFFNPNYSN